MSNEICIKDVAKVLSLFFALAVISLVLVYSNFEKGMDEAWADIENSETIFDSEEICQLIDLDNYETTGGVDEFEENPLVLEYMESGGETDVFGNIMKEYLREN